MITKTQKSPKKSTAKDPYELITQKFIEALEKGTNPFRLPWSTGVGGMPRNLSERPYRGINSMLTMFACIESDWQVPIFLTYKQAKEKGWQVRKGEKGTQVVFTGVRVPAKYKEDPESCPPEERYIFSKFYTVFNIHQIDGVDLDEYLPKHREFNSIESAEKIVSGYIDCPPIEHRGTRAYYSINEDLIVMPERTTFENEEAYYDTLFHEMGHSTGHKSRLKREMGSKKDDKEAYAFEELVAELTASFLCANAGIDAVNFDRSASYLASWLECLKGDKKFILQAASHAQKAVDHILGNEYA